MIQFKYSVADIPDVIEKILSFKKQIICFEGDLGAGKTTIAQFLIRKLYGDMTLNVKSPTFNIVYSYQFKNPYYLSDSLIIRELYHCDLYRLNSKEEIFEIGIDQLYQKDVMLLIEWPQLIYSLFPISDVLIVKLQYNEDNTQREISFF